MRRIGIAAALAAALWVGVLLLLAGDAHAQDKMADGTVTCTSTGTALTATALQAVMLQNQDASASVLVGADSAPVIILTAGQMVPVRGIKNLNQIFCKRVTTDVTLGWWAIQ
jgi:hypothetical protein